MKRALKWHNRGISAAPRLFYSLRRQSFATSVVSGWLKFSPFFPRCEEFFSPTTRRILHQPHSKPSLPGTAFLCAHFSRARSRYVETFSAQSLPCARRPFGLR